MKAQIKLRARQVPVAAGTRGMYTHQVTRIPGLSGQDSLTFQAPLAGLEAGCYYQVATTCLLVVEWWRCCNQQHLNRVAMRIPSETVDCNPGCDPHVSFGAVHVCGRNQTQLTF